MGARVQRHELQQNRKYNLLEPDTKQAIRRYSWPGNVRQLESSVERAVHLSQGGVLLPEHFGIEKFTSSSDSDILSESRPHRTLDEIESQAIADTLATFGGNICKTAQALGTSRPTIYRKLKKYGIKQD